MTVLRGRYTCEDAPHRAACPGLTQTTVCGGPDGTVSADDVRAGHTPPKLTPIFNPQNPSAAMGCDSVRGRGRRNRVRTGVHRRSGPQLQLDALSAADCLKTDTDTATGTKAARPQWNACLTDLRPVNTLICWEIDRPKSWADTLVPPSRPPSNSVPISGSHVRDGRSWPCAMSRSKDSSGGGSLSSPGADWWTCPV